MGRETAAEPKHRRRVVCLRCGWSGKRFGTRFTIAERPCPHCFSVWFRSAPVQNKGGK